jgi:hypothetical protein
VNDIVATGRNTNTTFYLYKHGFSVLLQNPADMEALRQYMHGSNPIAYQQGRTRSFKSGYFYLAAVMPAKPDRVRVEAAIITRGFLHISNIRVEFLNSSEDVEIKGDKPWIPTTIISW